MAKSYDIVKWEGSASLTVSLGGSVSKYGGTIYRKYDSSSMRTVGTSGNTSAGGWKKLAVFGSIPRTGGAPYSPYADVGFLIGWNDSKTVNSIKSGDKACVQADNDGVFARTEDVGEFTVIPNGGVE